MSIVADAADGAMGLTHGRYPDRSRSKAHSQGCRSASVETAGVEFIDENGGRPGVPEGTSTRETQVRCGGCLIDGEFTAPLLPARKALFQNVIPAPAALCNQKASGESIE